MQKLIVFCLALFVFCSIHSSVAGEDRVLQSTGYGGSTPSYSSNSSSSGYGSTPSSGYGSTPSSGYGGGSSSGYGSTPSYEEEYEETYEEHYEEKYEEYYEEKYEEHYEEQSYGGGGYTPSYVEEYTSGPYYGGYGSKPSYGTTEEEYETPSYGYGGTPYYNSTSNTTYTEHYEEAYTSGAGSANIPFVPTSLLTGFVVDIHFISGEVNNQYIAYHYCSDLYPGYTQCDVYNGTEANSQMIATEVIVTADIFAQLPMEERKLWHSHAFAVTSGILVSPNTPADQELTVMASVMNSYGKVTDFFHPQLPFPYGGAKLAYGLADQSQINATLADQLDQSLGLKTTWQQRAVQRKSLNPTILPGADDYLTSGQFPQYMTQWFSTSGSEIGETGETSGVVAGEEVGETSGVVPGEEVGETSGAVPGEEVGETSGAVPGEEVGETAGAGAGQEFGETAGAGAGQEFGETAGAGAGSPGGGSEVGESATVFPEEAQVTTEG